MSDLAELKAELRQLRQQNQAYRDAVAFTGHEWRNQLSVLGLATNRLLREANDTLTVEQKAVIQRIRASAAIMCRIALNYLELAQLESNSFSLHYTYVDPIDNVVNPVLLNYADLLAKHGQTYQINVSRPNLLVWADREALITVFSNLINNAIKYGEPDGEIVINVLERGTTDELSVWNSGPGITSDYLGKLFDLFTCGSDAENGASTGIGLYLVRRIVEAHGGCVRVESVPGGGANFAFTLPKHGVNATPQKP